MVGSIGELMEGVYGCGKDNGHRSFGRDDRSVWQRTGEGVVRVGFPSSGVVRQEVAVHSSEGTHFETTLRAE